MHTVTLRESEVMDIIREGPLCLMYAEASIMQFNIIVLVLDFTTHTRDCIHPQRYQSEGVRSGDIGGHANGTFSLIQRF
jgi:hypothetical protein